MRENIYIIYFSRTASAEAKAKQLHSSARINKLVHRKLYQHTLRKIKNTGIDFIEFNEYLQIGENFGQRITNAISTAFQKYSNVIIVGNDCPDIKTQDFLQAADKLNSGKQVLGRDKVGGAYLIGLRKDCWDAEHFEQLRWNSAFVASELSSILSSQSEFCELSPKRDLNVLNDIEALGIFAFRNSFIRTLINIVEPARNVFNFRGISTEVLFCSDNLFRGPPPFYAI